MSLPKISFLSPVFNEAHQIEKCLESIRDQEYPQDLIEIVIADGGCSDDTIKIASKFNCKIIDNPDKLPEPGLVRCEEAATGDLFVVMAADNRLPHKGWLNLMIKPFAEDKDVWGAYTHIKAMDSDNSFNRYYSLLHVEPFTWFVYGNASNPRYFKYYYQVMEQHSDYIIYSFNPKDHPLIAFAQGFMFRREFRRKNENRGDDILPFIQLIEEGHKIAYVPGAGILHLHLKGYKNYLKKYQWRVRNSLYKNEVGFETRNKYFTFRRKFKKYLWIIYSTTFIGPTIDSLRWYIRDKDKCWFWHIMASAGLGYLILYEFLRKNIFRKKA